jgi:hypothetical protein
MHISGVNLALTWPCRLCLLRVLLCVSLCYKLFPFQALGKVTLPSLSQACMFIYSSCEKWVFPPLLCSLPPTATFTSFPAPDYWAVLLLLPCLFTAHMGSGSSLLSCGVFLPPPLSQAFLFLVAGRTSPLLQSLFGPSGLFIYSSGKDSLSPYFSAQCAPPSFPHVFIVLIAY